LDVVGLALIGRDIAKRVGALAVSEFEGSPGGADKEAGVF
jgi:hypothetical protein